MKCYLAQLNPVIGAIDDNTKKIVQEIERAKKEQADLVIFSEMTICGYMPEDLLLEPHFVDRCVAAIEQIVSHTKGITAIIGTVRHNNQHPGKPFRNSAAVLQNGALIGFQDKSLLPTYDLFDEWRYFEPASDGRIWEIAGKKVAITICEDIWPTFDPVLFNRYTVDPLQCFEGKGVELLVNLSASPYSFGKTKTRKKVAKAVALRLGCSVVLVNQVGAQDGIIFDGTSVVVDASCKLKARLASFSEDRICIGLEEARIAHEKQFQPGQELFEALVLGVRDYFHKQGFTKACLGMSGGIDSAVVAAIAKEALGKESVFGLLLPSRFTSQESREDALLLCKNLEIETKELSIEPAFTAYLETLSPLFGQSFFTVVEENLQSRIRGTLLMAVANKLDYLLLNTGNKSELAMGYTTLYGDASGSISVIGDLLKREVYEVAGWINKEKEIIPKRVMTKAPSAELKFNQKDSDTLPEYPILDVIVDEFVVRNKSAQEIAKAHSFDLILVQDVIKKIHQSEYKRRQSPFQLRVSEKAFSCGRRIPIVQKAPV